MEGKGNSPHQGFIPLLPEMEQQNDLLFKGILKTFFPEVLIFTIIDNLRL